MMTGVKKIMEKADFCYEERMRERMSGRVGRWGFLGVLPGDILRGSFAWGRGQAGYGEKTREKTEKNERRGE